MALRERESKTRAYRQPRKKSQGRVATWQLRVILHSGCGSIDEAHLRVDKDRREDFLDQFRGQRSTRQR